MKNAVVLVLYMVCPNLSLIAHWCRRLLDCSWMPATPLMTLILKRMGKSTENINIGYSISSFAFLITCCKSLQCWSRKGMNLYLSCLDFGKIYQNGPKNDILIHLRRVLAGFWKVAVYFTAVWFYVIEIDFDLKKLWLWLQNLSWKNMAHNMTELLLRNRFSEFELMLAFHTI